VTGLPAMTLPCSVTPDLDADEPTWWVTIADRVFTNRPWPGADPFTYEEAAVAWLDRWATARGFTVNADRTLLTREARSERTACPTCGDEMHPHVADVHHRLRHPGEARP